MTMKVQEHVITTERKRHPNDVRYPCRGTHEIIDGGRKFFDSLTREQQKQLITKSLIIDEEETAELFDSVQEKDVIGLGINKTFGGFVANTYTVLKIYKDKDYMECENAYSKEVEEISFQDFSVGLAMNLAEILYRNDKPYGISTEQKVTLKIHYDDKEEGIKIDNSVPSSDSDLNGNPASGFNPLLDDENDAEITHTNTPVTPPVQTASIATENSEVSEQEEKFVSPVKWTDLYYSFGSNPDDFSPYVILTKKDLWDTEKKISDQSEADALADQLGLVKLSASTYDYNQKYSEFQLRMVFRAFSMSDQPDMTK